jgi:hypothetical protein
VFYIRRYAAPLVIMFKRFISRKGYSRQLTSVCISAKFLLLPHLCRNSDIKAISLPSESYLRSTCVSVTKIQGNFSKNQLSKSFQPATNKMRVSYASSSINNLSAGEKDVLEAVKSHRGPAGLLHLSYALLHSFPIAKGWHQLFSAIPHEDKFVLRYPAVGNMPSVIALWCQNSLESLPGKPQGA